jgi:hypothetical protein
MALIVSNGLVVTFDGEMRLVERGAVSATEDLKKRIYQ